ncbi:hypothetical protein F4859DRAFT_525382 [Xylaria cf. heliscus]|nr:hypothetical protein F4859DRAFT_525382 [Xylaria cf. heliscus]
MVFTGFTEPTFGLAAHFPELDPVALLQLVEAPVVRLAFYEFRSRFWDVCRSFNPPMASIQFVDRALDKFSASPAGLGRLSSIGGGECSRPDDYQMHDAFYAFMSRIYAWATQDYLDLPIRRHLEDTSIAASLLWGILGICISLYEDGNFPEPQIALPTEENRFEHVDDEVDVKDVENWKLATHAMRYTPHMFSLWQEWRLRHEALIKDEKERSNLARSWSTKIAEDYYSVTYNAAAKAHEWLRVLTAARVCKRTQKTCIVTKHCIFEIAAENCPSSPVATVPSAPSSPIAQ